MTGDRKGYSFKDLWGDMPAAGLISAVWGWATYVALIVPTFIFAWDFDPDYRYASWQDQCSTFLRMAHTGWVITSITVVWSLIFAVRYWLCCRSRQTSLISLLRQEAWARWVLPIGAPWLIPFLLGGLVASWLRPKHGRYRSEWVTESSVDQDETRTA